MTQMRAVYSPVNQALCVIHGRKGAPVERWAVISMGDWKVWPGRKEGQRMLRNELTRLDLRFAGGDPALIIADAPAGVEEENA